MLKDIYSVAALDMDGTLLNSNHVTTHHTRETLRRAIDAGKVVAISTGRGLSELRMPLKKMDIIRYIICENGACIYDRAAQKCIQRTPIPPKYVEYTFEVMERYHALLQFFIDNQSYLSCAKDDNLDAYKLEEYRSTFEQGSIFNPNLLNEYRQNRPDVGKINCYFLSMEDRQAVMDIMKDCPITMVDSIGCGLEFSAANINKGSGLRALCKLLNIPIEKTIAIGDSENDVEIIRTAGLGIAMGNACEKLKQQADYITVDCDHDGAAAALERFLF